MSEFFFPDTLHRLGGKHVCLLRADNGFDDNVVLAMEMQQRVLMQSLWNQAKTFDLSAKFAYRGSS